MPHRQKKSKGRNTQPLMMLPIAGTFFVKKTPAIQSQPNTLDFHLEIIKKIDQLLAEHERESPPDLTLQAPPIVPLQPPTPIEPRPHLSKTLAHEEMSWRPAVNSSHTFIHTIPEEFKTELMINPEFRFITSREFIDVISQAQHSPDERIEIIDLHTKIGENTTLHETTSAVLLKNEDDALQFSQIKNQILKNEQFNKKVEVIDARTLKQKIYEDACVAASQQADQIEKKAQIYFLSKKEEDDKKQKKLLTEQSYIPDDFEERYKTLKEKQRKEEEELRREYEQEPERVDFQETDGEDADQDEQEDVQKYKKLPRKNLEHTKTPRMLKKEAKEEKRLRRLEVRQARIEERRYKKEQKKALKLKLKQQHLKEKAMGKQSKQKGQKHSQNLKGKTAFQPELDEDIKKVLRMTDSLLEHLPDEVIDQFVQSDDFDIYQKVLNKYKVYERVMNKHRIK